MNVQNKEKLAKKNKNKAQNVEIKVIKKLDEICS